MQRALLFKIYLQPGARKSEICGKHGDCIKIKVQSPPIDGKANEALIVFIAKTFHIPKSSIAISSGEKSRFKTISIENIDENKSLEIRKQFMMD